MKRIIIGVLLAVVLICGNVLLYQNYRSHMKAQTQARDWEISTLKKEIGGLRTEMEQLQLRLRHLETTIERSDMVASWYGPGFHGRRASDGTVFNQAAFTCAHRTLPMGTILIIEYRGKRVPAMVTDRGPFIGGRDIDLSFSVAERLGMIKQGVATVVVYEIKLS